MSNKFPEEKYIVSVRCTREDLAEHYAVRLAEYLSGRGQSNDTVHAEGCCVMAEFDDFTDLLTLLPYYRTAVASLDGIPVDDVDGALYLDSISVQIRYQSRHWAERCLHEIRNVLVCCGSECGLSCQVIQDTTAGVTCLTWDALYALDSVIMRAGFGYSTYQEPEVQEPSAGSVSGMVMLAGVAAVVLLILLLAMT